MIRLTTTYNLQENGKKERGHGSIVKALAKVCKGRVGNWPKVFPYILWTDMTTHNSVTKYIPIKLVTGQKRVMSIEEKIVALLVLPWEL